MAKLWKIAPGIRRVATFLCVPMLLANVLRGQQSAEPHSRNAKLDWTFNFPAASLIIRSTGEKGFELSNKSAVTVKSYRLGCVHVDKKDLPVVTYRMDLQQEVIEAGESWGVTAFHSNRERAICESKNSQLSVLEVSFKDGTEWKAFPK